MLACLSVRRLSEDAHVPSPPGPAASLVEVSARIASAPRQSTGSRRMPSHTEAGGDLPCEVAPAALLPRPRAVTCARIGLADAHTAGEYTALLTADIDLPSRRIQAGRGGALEGEVERVRVVNLADALELSEAHDDMVAVGEVAGAAAAVAVRVWCEEPRRGGRAVGRGRAAAAARDRQGFAVGGEAGVAVVAGHSAVARGREELRHRHRHHRHCRVEARQRVDHKPARVALCSVNSRGAAAPPQSTTACGCDQLMSTQT